MLKRVALTFVLLMLILWGPMIVFAPSQTEVYRHKVADCLMQIEPLKDNQERKTDTWSNCSLQHHTVPGSRGWDETKIANADTYSLSFLELAPTGLALEKQAYVLQEHLHRQSELGRENVVIAYIHGWRRGAFIGDTNVQGFRLLLAYARSFLNTRCEIEGRFCNASLTGVYLGWHGRSLWEPSYFDRNPDHPLAWVYAAAAVPSFFSRKTLSDELGQRETGNSAIQIAVEVIEDALASGETPQSASPDKFMVLAHSLGGNAVASYLTPQYVKAVKDRKEGSSLNPIGADLVVLMNPAAEAPKWTSIQRAERERVGLPDDIIYAATSDALHYKEFTAWSDLYPRTQKPVYLSVTSTDSFSSTESRSGNKHSDWVTNWAFWAWAKIKHNKSKENQVAIGHLLPDYVQRSGSETAANEGKIAVMTNGPALGTSHDLILNSGPCGGSLPGIDCPEGVFEGGRTAYKFAGLREMSWCMPAHSRLFAAREAAKRGKPSAPGTNWDWGAPKSTDPSNPAQNIAIGKNRSAVQIRHLLDLPRKPGAALYGRSVAPARSPFWNIRATDSSVEVHSGFYSYAIWCSLNQIFLDKVAEQLQTK